MICCRIRNTDLSKERSRTKLPPEFVNDWTLIVQNNKVCCDYIHWHSRAFDSVQHGKLFTCLYSYNVLGEVLQWIRNFTISLKRVGWLPSTLSGGMASTKLRTSQPASLGGQSPLHWQLENSTKWKDSVDSIKRKLNTLSEAATNCWSPREQTARKSAGNHRKRALSFQRLSITCTKRTTPSIGRDTYSRNW